MENFQFYSGGNLDFSEAEFNSLMSRRVYRVLVICSNYDYFMLEEDGRIDEQIFNEYVALSLRYPPVFIHAESARQAFDILQIENIELVITMLSVGEMDAFGLSKRIKAEFPNIPIVVLTHFSREVSMKLVREDLSAIDYVFSWLGNANLLLAIIKLIEDRMNLAYDVEQVGVQAILLIEDSVRYYSSYLPNIYKIVFQQSKSFMQEGLNAHKKMLRMRGRPKILLATNYEEATQLYTKYNQNLLGIISDVSFKRNGKKEADAGINFCRMVRNENPYMPLLLQSSELSNQAKAIEIRASFIHKYSKTLELELKNFMMRYMAFGVFIFRDPDTQEEISRAATLKEMQEVILKIPANSLRNHFNNNDISKWLNARAFFQIAKHLKHKALEDFESVEAARTYIYDVISHYRLAKARGVISKFERQRFDEYMLFSRVGEGSLGGKARGLAFIDSFIKRHKLFCRWKGILVTIPRTVVLSTEIFEEFMEQNNLWRVATSRLSDEQVLSLFINATLPVKIRDDLSAFVKVARGPIAIRSSSLLEDSHYQPFAGIYSTFMIPKTESDPSRMLQMLGDAIKSVFASVYFKSSRAYMNATQNLIDTERMAIILQEVCGTRYGNRFYPTISGVARSINFYPIGKEKREDGIAKIAYGLGRMIVEGGISLRFSPKHPKNIIQLSTPKSALRETQKEFYALDLITDHFHPSTDDGVNLLKLRIKDAEKDGGLRLVASSYDFENDIIRDNYRFEGRKVLTFNNILRHDFFPLADIITTLLRIGEQEMNNPIEIEFAVNLDVQEGQLPIFNFLQIRPIVQNTDELDLQIEEIKPEEAIVFSESALGDGILRGIQDIVYIKPEFFRAADSQKIARSVEKINDKFLEDAKNYILVGPGRWGSTDPWLGIPVKWSHISAARLIVESGLKDFRVDPSQGTHFFQNLTSFKVGYFTVNPYLNEGFFNIEYLDAYKPAYEDDYLRHIHFERPVLIIIDGRKSRGVVYKEEFSLPGDKGNSG